MNISSCTQKQHTPSMHGSLYCLYFHVIEMEVSYIFLIFMRFFGKVEEFVLYYTVKNIIHFCPEHKVYAVTICANKYNTFILIKDLQIFFYCYKLLPITKHISDQKLSHCCFWFLFFSRLLIFHKSNFSMFPLFS